METPFLCGFITHDVLLYNWYIVDGGLRENANENRERTK